MLGCGGRQKGQSGETCRERKEEGIGRVMELLMGSGVT